MEYFIGSLVSFAARIPWIAAWLAGTVIAVKLFRRERGRVQRVGLWGFALMLAVSVIQPLLMGGLTPWFAEREMRPESFSIILSAINIPSSIIQLGAIVCIVYAFWVLGKARLSSNED